MLREDLHYITPGALRKAWKSRFGDKSDEYLKQFLENPKALANEVYNGRMGNRKGTEDGFNFRGAGFMQTTGREDFIKYGKLAGVDFSVDPPPSTDDVNMLLIWAAAEWSKRCNALCEADRFEAACRVINTGSEKIAANGMDDRSKWHRTFLAKLDKPVAQANPDAAPPAHTPDEVS